MKSESTAWCLDKAVAFGCKQSYYPAEILLFVYRETTVVILVKKLYCQRIRYISFIVGFFIFATNFVTGAIFLLCVI